MKCIPAPLLIAVACVLGMAWTTACDDSEIPEMGVTSPAFQDGATIPRRHTCDGENLSPPLFFHDVPGETVSFALVLLDLDALEGTRVHWTAWNLPGNRRAVDQGEVEQLDGVVQGDNWWHSDSYYGPCPDRYDPQKSEHLYAFRVYALDRVLALEAGAPFAKVKKELKRRALAVGEIHGLSRRE